MAFRLARTRPELVWSFPELLCHVLGFVVSSMGSSRRISVVSSRHILGTAISLRRLTYRDDVMVHYQGGKFHPGLGRDHQLVTPVEFLAMLVPHIALRYEVKIRTYGALSTTVRQ